MIWSRIQRGWARLTTGKFGPKSFRVDEEFRRAKRNLLFSCAACFLFAISSGAPPDTPTPSPMPQEVSVWRSDINDSHFRMGGLDIYTHRKWLVLALLLANLYYFYEYFYQWRKTKTKHSNAGGQSEPDALRQTVFENLEAIQEQLGPFSQRLEFLKLDDPNVKDVPGELDALREELEGISAAYANRQQFHHAMREVRSLLGQFKTAVEDDDLKAAASFAGDATDNFSSLDHADRSFLEEVHKARKQLEKVEPFSQRLRAYIIDVQSLVTFLTKVETDLVEYIRTAGVLHDDILGSDRTHFHLAQTWIPWAAFVSSSVLLAASWEVYVPTAVEQLFNNLLMGMSSLR